MGRNHTKIDCSLGFRTSLFARISSDVLVASYPSSETHIPWHDGDPAGVDAAEVGVLEQPDEVRLCPLLQRLERRRLKSGGDIMSRSCLYATPWQLNYEKICKLSVELTSFHVGSHSLSL